MCRISGSTNALRFGDPVAEKVGLLVELQIGRVARVLGGLLARIDGQPVVALGQVGLQVEALLEARGAVAQVALAAGELLELRVDLVASAFQAATDG